jgi:anaerobic glycerol-3-phosphate dehydrogenase
VVGGGAAGLSAALVLGRARLRTLLVDAGTQSNRVAEGIGGLLGHDGRPPAEFYAAGRAELAAYPSVQVRAGEVVRGDRSDDGFVLELADGAARRRGACCSPPAWCTASLGFRGSTSVGATRCSTVPSATAGRCGTRRSRCRTAAPRERSAHSCSGGGPTT